MTRVTSSLTRRTTGVRPTSFGMTAREAEEGESLDDMVAAEEPDMLSGEAPDLDLPRPEYRGQIDGTPEDGDSLFNVDE
jgi:hypothetical protein